MSTQTAPKAPRFPGINERTDLAEFPHIKAASMQFLKEVEYQIFDNPTWKQSERAWWVAMRREFLETVSNYEDEIQAAYMRGLTENYENMMKHMGDD